MKLAGKRLGVESITFGRRTSLETGIEPVDSLLGRAMRERLGSYSALNGFLDSVVTDSCRRINGFIYFARLKYTYIRH